MSVVAQDVAQDGLDVALVVALADLVLVQVDGYLEQVPVRDPNCLVHRVGLVHHVDHCWVFDHLLVELARLVDRLFRTWRKVLGDLSTKSLELDALWKT